MSKPPKPSFSIRLDEAKERLLQRAATAVADGDIDVSLDLLADLDVDPNWQTEVGQIRGRLKALKQQERRGEISDEDGGIETNRINLSTLQLIGELREEQYEHATYVRRIRIHLREKYQRRLDQKLGARFPVNLRFGEGSGGTTEDTAAVFRDFATGNQAERLSALFYRARGRLLLIGGAGSGKTSVLLEMALELLEWERSALPVVLDLATWQSRFSEIEDWLAEILPPALGVNNKLGRTLIDEFPLLLLLDGFDELPAKRREPFLAALGRYGAERSRRFVLTSRPEDYRKVQRDAPVRLQAEIEPLTFEQVLTELDKLKKEEPEAAALRVALERDPALGNIATNPFYLNTLQYLFAHGLRPAQLGLSTASGEHDRRTKIVAAFVDLNLDSANNPYLRSREYLGWLAENMRQENIISFELSQLQYDWMRGKSAITLGVGRLVQNTVAMAQFFLPLALFITLIVPFLMQQAEDEWYWFPIRFVVTLGLGVGMSLLLSFIMAIILMFYPGQTVFEDHEVGEIRTRDWSVWDWRSIGESLVVSGGLTVLGGLFSYFVWSDDMLADTTGVLVTFFMVFMLFFLLFLFIREGKNGILRITRPYQRFTRSARSLYLSILQHGVLRWQLWRRGQTPLRLVRFLNEMTDRKLLESNGATWRFRHRLIMDHLLKEKGK